MHFSEKNGSTLPVFPEKLVLMTYHIEGYQRLKKEQAQHQVTALPQESCFCMKHYRSYAQYHEPRFLPFKKYLVTKFYFFQLH